MKKKNRHINKYLHDKLPEPEVPADNAWGAMNGMLDAAAGGNSFVGKAGKWTANLMKFKGIIAISLAIISVTLLVIYKSLNSTLETPNHNIASNQTVKPLISSDSIKTFENQNQETIGRGKERLAESDSIPLKNPDYSQSASSSEKSKTDGIPIEKTDSKPIKKIDSEKHANASESLEYQIKTLTNKPKRRETKVNSRRDEGNQDIVAVSAKSGRNGHLPNNLISKTRGNEQVGPTSNQISNEFSVAPIRSFSVQNLPSKSARFPVYNPDLKNKIVSQNFIKHPAETIEAKKEQSRRIHIGLEWNINSSLKSTNYTATGADSINKVARLLIPGLFVTKDWQKHSLTFSFSPYQSYFGNTKKISQKVDSTLSTDSLKGYNNVRLIKAVGMNFNLQYQYHVFRLLALNGGLSYTMFSGALIRPELQTSTGNTLAEPLVTLKKSGELATYVNPHLFAIKAGISFTPGRFQAGFNVILPLSSVSKSPEFPVRALNGQVYLRFLVW